MKVLLRIWIIGTTSLLLLSPARLEYLGQGIWRGIPAMQMPVWASRLLETRVAVVQTLAIILALNFPAAVLLWKWDSLKAWIRDHRKKVAWTAGILIAAASIFLGVCYATYKPDTPETPPVVLSVPASNPNHILIPTMPATANQVRRAVPAHP